MYLMRDFDVLCLIILLHPHVLLLMPVTMNLLLGETSKFKMDKTLTFPFEIQTHLKS